MILHVDMDAFYASVEQREQPELKGKPVIVGGPKDARGVVCAASYEARKYGVRSAMPLRHAARLCPNGHFVPVRMKLYQEVSRAVFEIFRRYSPTVEPLSVDEAFLDLHGCERLFGSVVAAAEALRADILAELKLTASVGIATNKFLAKLASDLDKPNGLVAVPTTGIEEFLAPLSIERMWGVGPKAAERLHAQRVHTFGDLRSAGRDRLRSLMGESGERFFDLAAGLDFRAVAPRSDAKSVGHETTFTEDVHDEETLRGTLVALTDAVAQRLRKDGLQARTVTLKVRDSQFRTKTRRRTLELATAVTDTLLGEVFALWEAHRKAQPETHQKTKRDIGPIRLLGVSTSGFSAQASLFTERTGAVDTAIDEVRERYGRAAVRRGSTLR